MTFIVHLYDVVLFTDRFILVLIKEQNVILHMARDVYCTFMYDFSSRSACVSAQSDLSTTLSAHKSSSMSVTLERGVRHYIIIDKSVKLFSTY